MRLVEKSKNMEAEYSNYLNTESHLAGCTTVDDIRDEFRRLMSACKDEQLMLCFQWDYELFSLCEIRLGDRENNGFLFPEYVFSSGKQLPDLSQFEDERLSFYEARLHSSVGFRMRSRYLNYLIANKPKKERFHYVNILCNESLKYLSAGMFEKDDFFILERLIELSLSFNLLEILKNIKDLINFKLSEFLAQFTNGTSSEETCTTVHLFANILRHFRNKLNAIMPIDGPKKLVDLLEFCANDSDFSHKTYSLEEQVRWARIGGYRINESIRNLAKHFELLAKNEDNLSAAIKLYEKAAKLYLDNGMNKDEKSILSKIKCKRREMSASDEFRCISANAIDRGHIDLVIEHYVRDVNRSTVNQYINRLFSTYFIPNIERITTEANEISKQSIVSLIASISIDEGGRNIFSGDDDEAWKTYNVSTLYRLNLEVFFDAYKTIWREYMKYGMTAEMVIACLKNRSFIPNIELGIISHGIELFFQDDFISSLHILVPQFENVLRRFFENLDYPTTCFASDGTQKEQTFNEFLKNDFVKILPLNYRYLIEFVMINQIGLNLRNKVAHGLVEIGDISMKVVLIVIYLYFILCSIDLHDYNQDEANDKDHDLADVDHG